MLEIRGGSVLEPDSVKQAVTVALAEEIPGFTSLTLDVFLEPQSMLVVSRVMEAIPAMLAVFRNDLSYIYANRRYARVTNSSRTSWKGLTVTEYLPEYLHETILPRLAQAVAGEHVSYFVEIIPADGIARTMHVTYEPFIAGDGKSDFFLMSGIDVTDLKVAQQRLYAAQKLEATAQLTAGIAHDFNNQLSVVVGALSMLKNSEQSAANLRLIELCQQAADRSTKLTSQLLSFGRRQTLQPVAMSVAGHMDAILGLARISVPDNIGVKVAIGEADCSIFVDATQFESSLLDLIFNARDSMPDGGTITINAFLARKDGDTWLRTTESEHAQFVCIEVVDEGLGMDPGVAQRAFEPFFTTKPLGNGAGMGLAMVYGFVKQSGGCVELTTAPMRGTTIRLYLPRAEHAEHYMRAVTLTKPPTAVRLHILVVEDDEGLADIVSQLLISLGHLTSRCDNADDARMIIVRTKIDVVLTDVLIRGPVSGLELREEILQAHPDVHVLCMSGYPDPSTGTAYRLDSDIPFLQKPIRLTDLANALASVQQSKFGTSPPVSDAP
ncbi:MAG: ATP-binding protein [Hyphomicrobiaceae bacterium]